MRKIQKLSFLILGVLLLVAFCYPVAADTGKINLNTASKEQLMTIKGVGDKISDRIIEYRKAHPFKITEEIMEIKGLGQKFFDKNKDLLTVEKDE